MKPATERAHADLVRRRPDLESVQAALSQAFALIERSQRRGGRLLVCGNGGSAADALHIVGELGKSFTLPRPLPPELKKRLEAAHAELGPHLARTLQTPIRAVSLVSEASLITAVLNDTAADVIFAQQVLAQGAAGDVLLAISTSGNSPNILNAAVAAKAMAMSVIALSGPSGGKLKDLANCAILAPGATTSEIQEAHLPIYHTLCLMLEHELCGEGCEGPA